MIDTAFLLGNGPSLRGVDLERFSGVATIGMNAAYRYWERLGWYPTHYCCLDEELISSHHEEIGTLIADGAVETAFLTAGILDFHPELAENERCFFLDSFRKAWHKRRGKKWGLPFSDHPAFQSSAPSKLTTGAYAARYAMFLGYRRLYLLGIDCNYVEMVQGARAAGGTALEIASTPGKNPNYFFDDYQQAGDRYNLPNPEVHEGNLHLQSFEAVRDDIVEQDLAVEIWNCSSASKLASEGVFPYEDLDRALPSGSLGAVAVPMTFDEEDALVANLRSWCEPARIPRYPKADRHPVPLVLVLNGDPDVEFESRMRAIFNESHPLASSFSSLEFEYCRLSGIQDRYESTYSREARSNRRRTGGYKSGPNAQFFRGMELLRDYGRYVFMMETDCLPIRPNWLGELERIVDEGEPFWVLGSVYRGVDRINERYRIHINGNAVYAVGDDQFQTFLREVWRPALDRLVRDVPTLAYDCVLPFHFTGGNAAPDGENWELYQQVAHRFRYTEFIQNHSSKAETERAEGRSLDVIRNDSPRTYILHGQHFFPGVGAQSAPAAPARGSRAPEVDSAQRFEAVVVHQMGKVGSRSIFVAIEELSLWPCFHTHVLSRTHNPSLRAGETPVPPPRHREVPPHIYAARDLYSQYLDRDRPVVVVTGIREPIGRNVSAFFQNLDGFLSGTGVNADDPQALFELFRHEYPHRRPQQWVEEELNEPFNIDVFAEPFPEEGSVTLEAPPHRVLVLKASLPDEHKASILRELLGVDALTVPRVNVTERKTKREGRAAVYEQFQKCVGQDRGYIEEMLAMPMTSHFFTAQERDETRERWLEIGTTC